jgi:hypothetical protein
LRGLLKVFGGYRGIVDMSREKKFRLCTPKALISDIK